MKRTKKLLSFFLAIVMVITAFAVVPFTTTAADFNGNLTCSAYYYVANHRNDAGRINKQAHGNSINICNDGASDNFSSGWWGFSIADLPSNIGTITANLSVQIPEVLSGTTGIDFYATKDSVSGNVTDISGTGTTARDNALAKFPNRVKLGSYTSKSSGTFTASVGDAIKTAKESGWNNFNIFAIQSGVGNGNNSNKNWSDVWCKTPTISLSYSTRTYTVEELKALMTTYESRMSDSKLYNNMGAAYNAYVAASKAYDSYHYGLKTDINLTSYYTNLQNALYSMTEYTMSITQRTPGGFNGDSTSYSYTLGNTHQNVLYSPKVNFTDGTDEYVNKDERNHAKSEIRIAYPTTVLFYDGVKTPKFPIHAYFKRIDNGIIYVRNIYPALETATVGSYTNTYITRSSNFQFEQKWKGQSNNSGYNRDFLTPWFNTSDIKSIEVTGIAGNSLVTGYSTTWQGKWDPKWERAANVLSYTGTPTEAMNVYSLKWYKCNNDADNTTNLYSTVFEPSASKVYVLNYNGIKTLLTNKKALVNDISYFKENRNSTVSNLLSSFDNLAVDFNGLNYSSPDTVRSDLNSKYNTLNGRTATADNQAGYPAIRAAIDTPKQIPALVEVGDSSTYSVYDLLSNNNEDGKFTTSSYSRFTKAYNTVKNYMANVVTDGYAQADYADVAANALNKAINSLQVVADFTDVTANYTEASNILNTYDSSLYTTSTWAALVNAKNNATFATYTDTQKKDTGKSENQATIDSQADALRTAIDNLARRADFTNYNKAFDVATNSATGYLIPYTTNSVSTLPTYTALQKYNGITVYNNQDDTPDTVQSEIDTAAKALVKANTDVYTNTVDQSGLIAFSTSLDSYDKDVFDTATVGEIKTSANALYKVVNFNGTDYYSLYVTDQEDLDSKIRDYINSFNSSLDKYSVSVSSNVTVKVNGVTKSPNEKTGKYEFVYGTRVEFSAPTADTAWYMNYTSESAKRTQQFQKYAQTYTATIIGNMEVDARTKTESTPYRVTVERNYGVDGMTNGMAFVDFTAGGNYTLPTMPNHPYYSFDGYYVGGAELDGNTVNITGNTTVIAKYVKNGSNLNVNVNGSSSTYAYNSKVTISDSGAYAWVEKVNGTADTWRPFYIGSECTFRVTESIELKSVTKADFNSMFAGKEAFAPNTRQSGAIADPSTNKATINAQRVDYLPQGAQITEYGILVAKDARTDDFNLENTNENSIRAKSTKLISGNQFSIGLKNLANTNFTYRSYMIYQVPSTTDESGNVTSWETKTVYSEIMTYSGATV